MTTSAKCSVCGSVGMYEAKLSAWVHEKHPDDGHVFIPAAGYPNPPTT